MVSRVTANHLRGNTREGSNPSSSARNPEMGRSFKVDEQIYLVRCYHCGRENWSPSVASGICAWCGYDANMQR